MRHNFSEQLGHFKFVRERDPGVALQTLEEKVHALEEVDKSIIAFHNTFRSLRIGILRENRDKGLGENIPREGRRSQVASRAQGPGRIYDLPGAVAFRRDS